MTPDWAARPTSVPYAVFGDPQSLNLYVYVRNDPISRNDPDGHCMAHGEGDHCGPGSLADGFKMSLRQSEITAQGSETATLPEGEAQNNSEINTKPPTPAPPALVEYNGHTVTDPNVKKALSDFCLHWKQHGQHDKRR